MSCECLASEEELFRNNHNSAFPEFYTSISERCIEIALTTLNILKHFQIMRKSLHRYLLIDVNTCKQESICLLGLASEKLLVHPVSCSRYRETRHLVVTQAISESKTKFLTQNL